MPENQPTPAGRPEQARTRGLAGPLANILRPIFYLSHNLVSRLGVVLTTSAGVTLVLAYFFQLFGMVYNPYAGILVFLLLPAVFVAGLLLIPLGIYRDFRRYRRRGTLPVTYPTIDFRDPRLKRTAWFVAITTALNVPLFAVATYRGTLYMDSVQFCGQTCHQVMQPEYTAYQRSPHARVACIECHIGPGAPWFVRSKISGTYQLLAVTFNLYPRPIPTPVHNLRPARETCEDCHWPQKFSGDKLVVKTSFDNDEKNSATKTVLLVHIGGRSPDRQLVGIHGRHLGLVTYEAADDKRQVIPSVNYQNPDGSFTQFVSTEAAQNGSARHEPRTMDCMDCHNRPTHTFDMPESAVNREMAAGRISSSLPFVHKYSVELLKQNSSSRLAAQTQLPEAFRAYYKANYSSLYNSQQAQIEQAAATVLDIFNGNIFPEMNITWGTYPNNLGHTDFPGCFRCHDGNHKSKAGSEITQDCNACHSLLAMDEADPKVLHELYPSQ
ncbi:MAG: cytochrome C [Terriglobia bacterium]|jgi:nitrate/TMAO reductase-like tetraheme cytochrome c subunit